MNGSCETQVRYCGGKFDEGPGKPPGAMEAWMVGDVKHSWEYLETNNVW